MVSSFAKGILNSEMTAWLFSDYAFFHCNYRSDVSTHAAMSKLTSFALKMPGIALLLNRSLTLFCKIFFLSERAFFEKTKTASNIKRAFLDMDNTCYFKSSMMG